MHAVTRSQAVKMSVRSLWRGIATLSWMIATIHAQATTPSQTFSAGAATCSNGLATPAAQPPGGTYTDDYGTLWDVECGSDNSGTTYDPASPVYGASGNGPGTDSHGMYGCFIGCDRRVNCTGFAFAGSVSGMTTRNY